MAYSLLVSTSKSSTNALDVTTNAIDTSGADLIVVAASSFLATGTFSDSQSNTWSALTVITSGGNSVIVLYYCHNPSTSASHTFMVTSAGVYPSLAVAAFSGSATSPFDQQNGNFDNSDTIQTGVVVPSENNELLVTGLAWQGVSDPNSIDSGFTIQEISSYGPGADIGVALAYLIETTAASKNPLWSFSSPRDVAATIGTFKAATVSSSHVSKLAVLGAG